MSEPSFTISILIRQENNFYVAHCLELDIVATSDTVEGVKNDILSLIQAQIEYAFENENLNNLFHPAPAEVWREYYACGNEIEHRIRRKIRENVFSAVPQWLVAKTCDSTSHSRHA
ncbi:MAG: type II toxin-antitoxin system HicB family antitoxin [Candidatus Latescibacterota bacterium]